MSRRKKIKKMKKRNKGPTMMGQINGIALLPPSNNVKIYNHPAIVARRPRPACRSRTQPRSSKFSTKWSSAPSTAATAKKTKAWRTSKSCPAQASVRNGKRAISKSPAPAHHASPPASNKRTIPAGPRQIQYRAAAPRDKKKILWQTRRKQKFEGIPLWATKLD